MKRRCNEISLKGEAFDYEKIVAEIKERDEADKNREIAPLKKAEDAISINTTNMSIQEVTEEIIKLIKQNIK
ncbi:MAG: (d)CMP kinase [Erysipelotrichaceae bacterium]|nr:(d)CMP kinase [Erysipelotrichaceae bacterium]